MLGCEVVNVVRCVAWLCMVQPGSKIPTAGNQSSTAQTLSDHHFVEGTSKHQPHVQVSSQTNTSDHDGREKPGKRKFGME